MIKELSNKIIYDDFVSKMILTDDEKEVLLMLIKKYTRVKISSETCLSERSVARIIKELKEKYDNYKKTELAKCEIFKA